MKPEPRGKLRVVGAENRKDPHHLAVYARIFVEDEDGKRWSFEAAAFSFDLKPEPEKPE